MDLWRSVDRGTRICTENRANPRHAEVSQFYPDLGIVVLPMLNQDVLWFDVAMGYTLFLKTFQRIQSLDEALRSLLLGNFAVPSNFPEGTKGKILHH